MPSPAIRWRPAIDRWLADHHGVISIPEAVALGVPERTCSRAVERGELVQMLPGVVRSGDWPNGRTQLMAAALARNPSGALAFTTAAELLGPASAAPTTPPSMSSCRTVAARR